MSIKNPRQIFIVVQQIEYYIPDDCKFKSEFVAELKKLVQVSIRKPPEVMYTYWLELSNIVERYLGPTASGEWQWEVYSIVSGISVNQLKYNTVLNVDFK